MKILGLIVCFSAALFFQCEKKEINVSANTGANSAQNSSNIEPVPSNTPEKNVKNMDEVFRSAGKKGDIEFQIWGKKQTKGKYDGVNYPNDNLVIEYTVKNTGAKDFVLFNQGHSDSENRRIVYVEAITGGIIELSQKAFSEPKDKTCPLRDAPIMPRGVMLKAGQTVSGKVFVELPLKQKTPFDDCVPPTEFPQQTDKVKFCLGIEELTGKDTKITDQGIISPMPKPGKQEFLCSETFELK